MIPSKNEMKYGIRFSCFMDGMMIILQDLILFVQSVVLYSDKIIMIEIIDHIYYNWTGR